MLLKKEMLLNSRVEVKVMKKQLVIIGLVTLLISVGLSGCTNTITSNSDRAKFIGSWDLRTTSQTIYTLNEDNSLLQYGFKVGNWSVKEGGILEFDFSLKGNLFNVSGNVLYNYVFSNNDNILTLRGVNSSASFVLIKSSSVSTGQTSDYTYTVMVGVAIITKYTGTGGAITIPSTLGGYPTVAIGYSDPSVFSGAFASCSSLTSVTIPSSVTTIGTKAFYFCSSLTSVTIPSSVTTIGEFAFFGCSSLTSMIIPSSVTTIRNYTFDGCSSLTSVTIGSGVITIGEFAFSGCSSLTSVTIPSSVTIIGDSAFASCSSMTSVTIPNSVTIIGDSAFASCSSMTSVIIPDSVTTIVDGAFSGCSSLTSVTIPDSVTTIGNNSFASCSSLTSVTIPNSVITIGFQAFYLCALTSVTIPNSVTTIKENAFISCSSMTSVTIGSGVTFIGDWAFYNCHSLISITFLGLVAPTAVGFDWLTSTPGGLLGHASASSNFPAPGDVWHGLTMGTVL